MKLIISQYLASLKERDELDVILPDLLSELGLTVFSRPGRGTTQDGVDVAATGSLDGKKEKVYLLSIKSGDLTRSTWNSDSHQALRPSLEEILDSYIPNRLPVQHRNKDIVICLCFGGSINEQVRPKVEGFIERNSKGKVRFEEWNGDFIADLILKGFLREDLLPNECRAMLRKALALIDEPEYSYRHYSDLILWFNHKEMKDEKSQLMLLRQLHICLWILFAWCRDYNNLEPAYLAAELTLLNIWEIKKLHSKSQTKVAKEIAISFSSFLHTFNIITNEFLEKCVNPHVGKKHSISNAVRGNCKFDVSLRLFDILSRLSVKGIWLSNEIRNQPSEDDRKTEELISSLHQTFEAIKQLIVNNPVLMAPIKDDQAIDLSIAIYCLLLDEENFQFIKYWLGEMVYILRHSYWSGRAFPAVNLDYAQLINVEESKTKEQLEELTRSSISYPLIGVIASLLEMNEIREVLSDFCENSLKHCEMQYWYPLADTEKFLYTNKGRHGGVLHPIDLVSKDELLLEQVFSECENTDYFGNLTAVSEGLEPLVAVACRHYRYPLPMHFFLDDYELFKHRASVRN